MQIEKVVRVSEEQLISAIIALDKIFLCSIMAGDIAIHEKATIDAIGDCLDEAKIEGYQISE